nr:unnamed protein product [Digitaria exilis]
MQSLKGIFGAAVADAVRLEPQSLKGISGVTFAEIGLSVARRHGLARWMGSGGGQAVQKAADLSGTISGGRRRQLDLWQTGTGWRPVDLMGKTSRGRR